MACQIVGKVEGPPLALLRPWARSALPTLLEIDAPVTPDSPFACHGSEVPALT